ncbi:MAG TPA: S41 family peptidase [Gaiellaceae bacterium]|nr:S41 family peptidase [Gaiellaceae bacterium]
MLGFALTRPADPATAVAPAERPREKAVTLVEEVRADLARSYYRSIDPAVLRRPSVEELIRGLEDPHTDYLSPAEFEALKDRTEGSYSGIGLTVGPSREGLVVTAAFKGPAQRAGIRRGDVIVRIDGKPAWRMPFERSLALIKGEKGTVVNLTVKRATRGTIRFQVVRQEIDVPPIQSRVLEGGEVTLGYLRVLSFPVGTASRLDRATARLVEAGAEGVVLDLRDNPGGLLSQAVDSVSLFVEEGVVVRTDGAHQDVRAYSVDGTPAHPTLPLVVLVNGGSASAAEIVAAALAENGRATIVGDRTFGKASVQSIEPLSNGGALKLTTAKYVTPGGVDISETGIRPKLRAIDDPLTKPDEGLALARRALLALLAS